MTVRVLLFGPFARAFDARQIRLDLPVGARVRDANAALASRLPDHAELLVKARLAVNGRFAPPDAALAEGDEVVVVELVGGG